MPSTAQFLTSFGLFTKIKAKVTKDSSVHTARYKYLVSETSYLRRVFIQGKINMTCQKTNRDWNPEEHFCQSREVWKKGSDV